MAVEDITAATLVYRSAIQPDGAASVN
jgi:hypothetical protein